MISLDTRGSSAGQYLSEDRNLLLNANMLIDQFNEGGSVSLVSGTAAYIADGWGAKFVSAGSTVTAQRVSDAPPPFTSSIKLTTTLGSAVGVGEYLIIESPVLGLDCGEANLGFGATGAAYVSAQFWVKSSVTGTFSYCLQNSAGNRTYVGQFTISNANTWTPGLVPNIAGDTTGTWLTTSGVGMYLFIVAACGSTNQTSMLGSWQAASAFAASTQTNTPLSTTNATFQVAAPFLEPGPVNTQFPAVKYDRALSRCRAQLRKTFLQGTAPAQSAGLAGALHAQDYGATAGELYTDWRFDQPMIASPAVTTYNPSAANANWRDVTGSSDVVVKVDPDTAKSQNNVPIGSQTTALTAGHHAYIHALADARLTLF